MSCVGLFVSFLYNCLPRRNQPITESLQYALHLFLVGCILIVFTQQVTRTIEVYYSNQQEYLDALKLYTDENCAMYRGSSRARIQECSELATIIKTSILMRTFIVVTQSWNSCIYLPCTDLVTTICNSLQYKIALVLILLAIISYSMKIFRCTKKRSKEYLYWKQHEITQQQQRLKYPQQERDLENIIRNIQFPKYSTNSTSSSSSSSSINPISAS